MTELAVARPPERARRAWLLAGQLMLGAVVLSLAALKLGEASDDIYITYRYASHFADGLGLVFNPGERAFGVSDPGIAVLLGGLRAAFHADIPAAGTLLTALALWAIAGIVLAEGARRGRAPEAAAGALAITVFPALWVGQGSGPAVALAFLVLAARLVAARPVLAGLLAGAAVWCRPDAVFGVALLAWLTHRRRLGLGRYVATVAAAIGVGMLGAYLAFGTLVPNTLIAKRLSAAAFDPDFDSPVRFWGRAYRQLQWASGDSGWLLLLLASWGLFQLGRVDSPPLRLIAVYALISGLFYTATGVTFFPWYTVPLLVAVLVAAPWAAGDLLRRLTPRLARAQPRPLAVALVCALLFVPTGLAARDWFSAPSSDWRLGAYSRAGRWIADHTPPSADVTLAEVGILGYFSQRPVRDLVGLVSPEVLPYVAVGDVRGAFLLRPSELVVFHTFTRRGGTRPIVDSPWFARSYREAARFSDPASGKYVAVFQRIPGAPALPPTRPPAAARRR